MLTLDYKHRLGNCLLQYCAAYLMAEKHDLLFNVEACNANKHVNSDWGNFFNIQPPNGARTYEDSLIVTIKNYNEIYCREKIKTNLHLSCYFQHKSICIDHADRIKNIFNLAYDETDPSEVFVMYRIGDLNNRREMVPKEYYEEVLRTINASKGYISSDSPEHPFILDLCDKYHLKIFNASPLETLNFAKNFNNIVIGEGTFHWWAAFLSKASNIFYNKRQWSWFGKSIYDFPEWKFLSWDWDAKYVEKDNRLTAFHPIRLK
jgi:hypothetical protein